MNPMAGPGGGESGAEGGEESGSRGPCLVLHKHNVKPERPSDQQGLCRHPQSRHQLGTGEGVKAACVLSVSGPQGVVCLSLWCSISPCVPFPRASLGPREVDGGTKVATDSAVSQAGEAGNPSDTGSTWGIHGLTRDTQEHLLLGSSREVIHAWS